MQVEILTSLAKIADLKVISRTSVQIYKREAARNVRAIGRELGVANVLEGSVKRMGNQLPRDGAMRACKLEQLSGTAGALFPRSWFEGLIARERGDTASVRAGLLSAREYFAEKLRESPDDAILLALTGAVDARLGRAEDAIAAGKRATQLLPMSKDALDGPTVATYVALTYA